MRQLLILVAVLGMVAAGPVLVTTAQDATTEATLSGTPVPLAQLDLAALTLRPSDLDNLGLPGLGLANQSSLWDAEADALIEADGDAAETAARLAVSVETGFQYRYVGSLLRPRMPLERLPDGLFAAQQRISMAVSQYATAEGAATAFAMLETELGDPGAVTCREYGPSR